MEKEMTRKEKKMYQLAKLEATLSSIIEENNRIIELIRRGKEELAVLRSEVLTSR
jgi:hypothetical protein